MPIALFNVVGAVASLAVAMLLLFAGASKLRHRATLGAVIANYRLLPRRLVAPVAASLPVVELAVGGLLLVGPLGAPAAVAAATLLLLFAAAMGVNIRRGRTHIDCGCGFGPRQSLHAALVWRNVALAVALLPRIFAHPTSALDMLVALPAAAATLLLLLFLDLILTLRRTSSLAA